LHSHTLHSRESLEFIPDCSARVPVLKQLVGALERRYRQAHGRALDYSRTWWTPPLSARDALRLESRQIRDELGKDPLVSLTDHDNIEAALHLRLLDEGKAAPISVEWTAPFQATCFHIGVHNLPALKAGGIMSALSEYTRMADPGTLAEVLVELSNLPETLVVLNHLLWDEAHIGAQAHRALAMAFLGRYGSRIHALELNGLRPWCENRRVIEIAHASGHPVVSGGDRHGCEPSACLNLTNASEFAEFVDETRHRRSEVLLMPQYRQSLVIRQIETIRDVLRDYPEFAGRKRWSDRLFYRKDDRTEVPLSEVWQGDGPGLVRNFVGLVRLFDNPGIRAALRTALPAGEEVAL
jgi:hypothetical protein